MARHISNAGHARHIAQLVHARGIDHKDLAAELLLQLAGELHAEIGRVLHAALSGGGVLDELIVDGVHVRKINVVFAQKVHDDLLAIRQLRIHRGELQKHGGVVEHVGFQNLAVVFEKRQLR